MYYFSLDCTRLISGALHNNNSYFMEEEFTIIDLQEIISQRGLNFEIDDFYTSIAQGSNFIDVINDLYRRKPKLPFIDNGELETMVLKSLNLWQRDYLNAFDSRFKHNWVRDGLKFIIPAFISKTDFEDQRIKQRIMAVNIAYAANKKFKKEIDFEEYQAYMRKNPERLGFSGDRMIAMSLGLIYKSKRDSYNSFKEDIEFYLQGEWSKKWMELFVLPVFVKIEQCLKLRFDEAIKRWGTPSEEHYKYYPIAVHYNNGYTSYKVVECLIEDLNEQKEEIFQKVIASVVNTKPHIEAEIRELKHRHFSPYSTIDESWIYRVHRENAHDALAIDADFEEIVRWSTLKSAADFIFILEDRLAVGDTQKDTDLTLAEFSNLAFFLAEIDLFDKPESAVLHLSRFFKGVDSNRKPIELKYGTLKMKKDITIIDELKKVFGKINK